MRACAWVIAAMVAALATTAPVVAGEADVVAVTASREAAGTWRFDVSIAHDDDGWSHYADRWDVIAPDGRILGSRILLHPHESEQPFTRSLTGLAISDDIARVTVRAHDSVHGEGGREMIIELARPAD